MEIINYTEAKRRGLKYYFTGKPCKKGGHVTQRFTSSGLCLGCMARKNAERSEYKRQHKLKNAERYRELGRQYREQNRDKMRAYLADYYQANKEYFYEASKKTREENRERDRAYKRKWNRENRAYGTARVAERNALKQKATLRGLSIKDFTPIYTRRSEVSEETGVEYHVDHYYPLQGKTVCGLHVPWNLHVITAAENTAKGNKMPEEFYGPNHTPPTGENQW